MKTLPEVNVVVSVSVQPSSRSPSHMVSVSVVELPAPLSEVSTECNESQWPPASYVSTSARVIPVLPRSERGSFRFVVTVCATSS